MTAARGMTGPDPLPVPAPWADAIAGYVRHARTRGLAETTLDTYTERLRTLARALAGTDPWDVTLEDLVDWSATHRDWSKETRRGVRTTLRSFYRWAAGAGHVTTSPATELPVVVAQAPRPRPASETAVHFAILTATPRERLMVRLAAELGMRRGEVACAHTRDLVEDGAGWSLVVHGKGSKDRVVPLPHELAAELRALRPGWFFPSPASSGHLTPRYVGKLVRRLLPEGTNMHALRHRFATGAYELTHDVLVVQRLLGHARPETTQRYVDILDDRLRAAVQDLATATTRSPAPAGTRP